MMSISTPKMGKRAVGLTAQKATVPVAGVTAKSETLVTPKAATRKYKPRARKCANKTCGKLFTPAAKHGRFCSDNCRKTGYRQRLAKTQKPKSADPVLSVTTCEYCGATFFAEAGKGAKFCSPSHKTAAYRHRRTATMVALISTTKMAEKDAFDLLENVGMQNCTRWLRLQGYVYDEYRRTWMIPFQSANIFAQADGHRSHSVTALE